MILRILLVVILIILPVYGKSNSSTSTSSKKGHHKKVPRSMLFSDLYEDSQDSDEIATLLGVESLKKANEMLNKASIEDNEIIRTKVKPPNIIKVTPIPNSIPNSMYKLQVKTISSSKSSKIYETTVHLNETKDQGLILKTPGESYYLNMSLANMTQKDLSKLKDFLANSNRKREGIYSPGIQPKVIVTIESTYNLSGEIEKTYETVMYLPINETQEGLLTSPIDSHYIKMLLRPLTPEDKDKNLPIIVMDQVKDPDIFGGDIPVELFSDEIEFSNVTDGNTSSTDTSENDDILMEETTAQTQSDLNLTSEEIQGNEINDEKSISEESFIEEEPPFELQEEPTEPYASIDSEEDIESSNLTSLLSDEESSLENILGDISDEYEYYDIGNGTFIYALRNGSNGRHMNYNYNHTKIQNRTTNIPKVNLTEEISDEEAESTNGTTTDNWMKHIPNFIPRITINLTLIETTPPTNATSGRPKGNEVYDEDKILNEILFDQAFHDANDEPEKTTYTEESTTKHHITQEQPTNTSKTTQISSLVTPSDTENEIKDDLSQLLGEVLQSIGKLQSKKDKNVTTISPTPTVISLDHIETKNFTVDTFKYVETIKTTNSTSITSHNIKPRKKTTKLSTKLKEITTTPANYMDNKIIANESKPERTTSKSKVSESPLQKSSPNSQTIQGETTSTPKIKKSTKYRRKWKGYKNKNTKNVTKATRKLSTNSQTTLEMSTSHFTPTTSKPKIDKTTRKRKKKVSKSTQKPSTNSQTTLEMSTSHFTPTTSKPKIDKTTRKRKKKVSKSTQKPSTNSQTTLEMSTSHFKTSKATIETTIFDEPTTIIQEGLINSDTPLEMSTSHFTTSEPEIETTIFAEEPTTIIQESSTTSDTTLEMPSSHFTTSKPTIETSNFAEEPTTIIQEISTTSKTTPEMSTSHFTTSTPTIETSIFAEKPTTSIQESSTTSKTTPEMSTSHFTTSEPEIETTIFAEEPTTIIQESSTTSDTTLEMPSSHFTTSKPTIETSNFAEEPTTIIQEISTTSKTTPEMSTSHFTTSTPTIETSIFAEKPTTSIQESSTTSKTTPEMSTSHFTTSEPEIESTIFAEKPTTIIQESSTTSNTTLEMPTSHFTTLNPTIETTIFAEKPTTIIQESSTTSKTTPEMSTSHFTTSKPTIETTIFAEKPTTIIQESSTTSKTTPEMSTSHFTTSEPEIESTIFAEKPTTIIQESSTTSNTTLEMPTSHFTTLNPTIETSIFAEEPTTIIQEISTTSKTTPEMSTSHFTTSTPTIETSIFAEKPTTSIQESSTTSKTTPEMSTSHFTTSEPEIESTIFAEKPTTIIQESSTTSKTTLEMPTSHFTTSKPTIETTIFAEKPTTIIQESSTTSKTTPEMSTSHFTTLNPTIETTIFAEKPTTIIQESSTTSKTTPEMPTSHFTTSKPTIETTIFAEKPTTIIQESSATSKTTPEMPTSYFTTSTPEIETIIFAEKPTTSIQESSTTSNTTLEMPTSHFTTSKPTIETTIFAEKPTTIIQESSTTSKTTPEMPTSHITTLKPIIKTTNFAEPTRIIRDSSTTIMSLLNKTTKEKEPSPINTIPMIKITLSNIHPSNLTEESKLFEKVILINESLAAILITPKGKFILRVDLSITNISNEDAEKYNNSIILISNKRDDATGKSPLDPNLYLSMVNMYPESDKEKVNEARLLIPVNQVVEGMMYSKNQSFVFKVNLTVDDMSDDYPEEKIQVIRDQTNVIDLSNNVNINNIYMNDNKNGRVQDQKDQVGPPNQGDLRDFDFQSLVPRISTTTSSSSSSSPSSKNGNDEKDSSISDFKDSQSNSNNKNGQMSGKKMQNPYDEENDPAPIDSAESTTFSPQGTLSATGDCRDTEWPSPHIGPRIKKPSYFEKPLNHSSIVINNIYAALKDRYLMKNNGKRVILKMRPHATDHATITSPDWEHVYIFHELVFMWTTAETYFPLEVHIVHYAKEYGNIRIAKKEQNGVMIASLAFQVSKENNPGFDPVVENLEFVNRPSEFQEFHGPIDVRLFFPMDMAYYRYKNISGRTPCADKIFWVVFRQSSTISPIQLQEFYKIVNRKGQPIKHNFITESTFFQAQNHSINFDMKNILIAEKNTKLVVDPDYIYIYDEDGANSLISSNFLSFILVVIIRCFIF